MVTGQSSQVTPSYLQFAAAAETTVVSMSPQNTEVESTTKRWDRIILPSSMILPTKYMKNEHRTPPCVIERLAAIDLDYIAAVIIILSFTLYTAYVCPDPNRRMLLAACFLYKKTSAALCTNTV